jgi:hypothetical protein
MNVVGKSSYAEYQKTCDNIKDLIDYKEKDIEKIEKEIFHLKQTKRLLDEKFMEKLNTKMLDENKDTREKYIG